VSPMERGIVLLGGEDKAVAAGAKAHKLSVVQREAPCVPWNMTLLVESGSAVPWKMLNAAWFYLRRWDAAVPLWRYGQTAADVGTAEEREQTRAIVRDLRVPLYSHELLFVRKNGLGQLLVATWAEEMEGASEKRLPFLRAYYRIKPRLCALPATWRAELKDQFGPMKKQASARRRKVAGEPMVQIQVAPGVTVQCRESEEQAMRARWAKRLARRHEVVR
jgi:hypothetical protein